MEELTPIEKIRESAQKDIKEQSCECQLDIVTEEQSQYEIQTQDNKLVNAVMQNDSAQRRSYEKKVLSSFTFYRLFHKKEQNGNQSDH